MGRRSRDLAANAVSWFLLCSSRARTSGPCSDVVRRPGGSDQSLDDRTLADANWRDDRAWAHPGVAATTLRLGELAPFARPVWPHCAARTF